MSDSSEENSNVRLKHSRSEVQAIDRFLSEGDFEISIFRGNRIGIVVLEICDEMSVRDLEKVLIALTCRLPVVNLR